MDKNEYLDICNKTWFHLTVDGCNKLYKRQETLHRCVSLLQNEDFIIHVMDCSLWTTWQSFDIEYGNKINIKSQSLEGYAYVPKNKGVVLVLEKFGDFFNNNIEEAKRTMEYFADISRMYSLFDRKLLALLQCENLEFNNILLANDHNFKPIRWINEDYRWSDENYTWIEDFPCYMNGSKSIKVRCDRQKEGVVFALPNLI